MNIGRDNFNELRFDYFRDATVALEAFKADRVDWRIENSAKEWATFYDFPAVKDGRVIKEEFPVRSSGIMQAFVFNLRRDKFKDPRVRRAFNMAFDFEEMNKQIFFGQYWRIGSYFEGTELASTGLPQGQELEILESVRDKVPPEVFTTPYTNPAGGNPELVRDQFARSPAAVARGRLRGARSEDGPFQNRRAAHGRVSDPATDPNGDRFVLFYKPSLERLGIAASVFAPVDEAQYENRLRQLDFDVITACWPESLSPGNEQRGYWGSQAADQPGSRNIGGIKNPAVDALIDRVIFAKDRAELEAATKALDRVLLWNHYVVPQWTYGKLRTARWDRFGHPSTCRSLAQPAFRSSGGGMPRRPRSLGSGRERQW